MTAHGRIVGGRHECSRPESPHPQCHSDWLARTPLADANMSGGVVPGVDGGDRRWLVDLYDTHRWTSRLCLLAVEGPGTRDGARADIDVMVGSGSAKEIEAGSPIFGII